MATRFTGSAYVPYGRSSGLLRQGESAGPGGGLGTLTTIPAAAVPGGGGRASGGQVGGSDFGGPPSPEYDETRAMLGDVAQRGGQVGFGVGLGRMFTSEGSEARGAVNTLGQGLNSVLGPLNTYLALSGQGSDAAKALGAAKGLSQTTQGVSGLAGASALSKGAGAASGLLGIGSGALKLAEGGNEGEAAVDIASGVLAFTPAAPIGLLLQAGVMGDKLFNDRYDRLRRETQRRKDSVGVLKPLAEGLGQVKTQQDLRALLDQPTPGGAARYGDVLYGMVRDTLAGHQGWEDPYHFTRLLGFEPKPEYVGLAGALSQMGYFPAEQYTPGTNLAEVVTWSGNPHSAGPGDSAGAETWRRMLDALAPIGRGKEAASPVQINPGAQQAWQERVGRMQQLEAERQAQRAQQEQAYASWQPSYSDNV